MSRLDAPRAISTSASIVTEKERQWNKSKSLVARRVRNAKLRLEGLETRDTPTTYNWLPTGPGVYNWSDDANWSGTGIPSAADDVANMSVALTGNQVVNLGANYTIGTLNLGSTGSTGAITIAANGTSGKLTFDVTSGSASLSDTSTATKSGDAVLAPIVLKDNLNLSSTGTNPLSLGGDVTAYTSTTPTVTMSGTTNLFNSITIGAGVTIAGTGSLASSPVLFVTSYYDDAIYGVDADTGVLRATLVAPNTGGLLDQPAGQTIGPDGNLYISSQNSNAVLRYNFATDQVETFISSSVLQPIAVAQLGLFANFRPAGLKFGTDGRLFVSLNGGFANLLGGAVVRFGITNTSGVLSYSSSNTVVATGIVQPSGLTFGVTSGDTGNLYVSSSLLGGIDKITGATGSSPSKASFIAYNSGGLQFPSAVAFDSSGAAYVADLAAFNGNGKVLKYNSNGTFNSTFVATGTTNPGDLKNQFPSDLLFDSSGRLLLANLGNNGPTTFSNDYIGSVYRYSSAGSYQAATVSYTQYPNTAGPSDTSATGIIPSQISLRPAAVLNFAGTFSPDSTTTLNVPSVNFTSAAAVLVDISGVLSDSLDSSGVVNLNNATLTVSLLTDPDPSTVYTIVSGTSIVGTFDGLNDGDFVFVGDFIFTINYTSTAVTLTLV